MKKKSLFVCMPDFPFPARKNGISIRYYPILEHASKEFDIHLAVISNSEVSQELIAEAQKFCTQVSVYVRKPTHPSLLTKCKVRAVSLLPVGVPYEYLHFDEQSISTFVAEVTRNNNYDLALCAMITYQHLVARHVKAKRYTLDVIDSPYATARRKCGGSLLKIYDAFMVKLWERRALASVNYACYISPLDREIGSGQTNNEKIGIIPNGLFLHDHTLEKNHYECKTIGYLGHMGYPPNIRAALRLYEIFKARKNELANCKLVIIGRDPAPEITKLAQDPNVIVTGTVDNIWPFINAVDVFAFPMEIGSGQQNKLLEAMGAGKPVISTALGNSGIGATHPNEIITADSDEDIGANLVALINDKARADNIGQNAKSFIEKVYSWEAIYNTLNRTLLKT